MIESQSLGGDVSQLMVSLFGTLHIITTASVTHDPTAAPETAPLGSPPTLRSLCDSTDPGTEHALSLWLTRLAAVWSKLLSLEKDEVHSPA